jgi:hypothetical protein
MYNNYGYNPYYPQQRFQGVEQNGQPTIMPTYQTPIQINKTSALLGKSVDNIDVVKATDIPLDGSISYFPLTDGSAIVSKQLQMDGTSKMIVYKPVKEDNDDSKKFVTFEEMQSELAKIDILDLEDLKDEIKEIKKQLKNMKKPKED